MLAFIVLIVIVWFFFVGFRLIGYISEINSRGFRMTVCGTDGCSDAMLVLNSVWTASVFILIPLIIPIILAIYFIGFKKISDTQ